MIHVKMPPAPQPPSLSLLFEFHVSYTCMYVSGPVLCPETFVLFPLPENLLWSNLFAFTIFGE